MQLIEQTWLQISRSSEAFPVANGVFLTPGTNQLAALAGSASASAAEPLGSTSDRQPVHARGACVACVWNEANALRVQLGLPLGDFHISLGSEGTELRLHSLGQLLPASPFQLDDHKLIQVGSSAS